MCTVLTQMLAVNPSLTTSSYTNSYDPLVYFSYVLAPFEHLSDFKYYPQLFIVTSLFVSFHLYRTFVRPVLATSYLFLTGVILYALAYLSAVDIY
jgi:hypothetical protein